MQVHAAELRDDEVENIGLPHRLDFVLELEVLEDAANVGRKALDVAHEVLSYVVRISF